eukprot:2413869-Amphidinium_carterae.1
MNITGFLQEVMTSLNMFLLVTRQQEVEVTDEKTGEVTVEDTDVVQTGRAAITLLLTELHEESSGASALQTLSAWRHLLTTEECKQLET